VAALRGNHGGSRLSSTRRLRTDEAITLMEVMIALSLLLLIILPMSYLLGSVLNQSTNTKASVAAGLIAEQELEESHAILSAAMTAGASSVCTATGATGPSLPCTVPEAAQKVQGFNYSVALYFQWTSISGTANVCKSGVIPQVVLAQVTVSWGPNLQSVSESSIINLPYIASTPTNGFLAVQVSNAAGKGTAGVLVTASTSSPSYTTSALTDSHGCAFITVPSSTSGYTVSLSPPTTTPGVVYVDQTNNPSPSQTNQAVSAQGISTVTFQYDQAATLDLNYPSVTGVADGVTCTTTFCIATGQNQTTTTSGTNQTNGAPTGEILVTTNGTSWTPVSVTGLTRLLGISCPTTSMCEGVGTGTGGTGIAFGVSIASGTWTIAAQTLPAGVNISQLSSVWCTSATSCYAVGYGVTGGTRSGVMLSYNGSAWSKVTTSGVELIGSIACPTATTCVLTTNNTTAPVPSPVLYAFNTSTSVFSTVTLSPAPTTLSQVTCGTTTANLCVLTGTVGTNAAAWVSNNSGSTWTAVTGIPAGASTLGTPVCTTISSCLVNDNTPSSTSGQILVLTGTPSAAPTSWAATAATEPAGVQSLSDLACQSTTCLSVGQVSGSPGQGVLLTSTNSGSTWSSTSLPGTATPTFLTGVGCLPTWCAASGEATTSDLLYGSTSGAWATDTVPTDATGVTGLIGAGWSASVGNTNLAPYPFKEIAAAASPATAASPNPITLTPLFPFTTGYTVWPGGCAAEAITPTSIAVTPGGTATATVALAPVTLEVVDATGQPVPGATVTLAQNNASSYHCPAESFAMPTTAGDGLSRAGFSYGAYTATITDPLDSKSTTAALTINASSVVGPTGTTYPEPDPVVVTIS
jgi:Tfp pilus assembly protein PilV